MFTKNEGLMVIMEECISKTSTIKGKQSAHRCVSSDVRYMKVFISRLLKRISDRYSSVSPFCVIAFFQRDIMPVTVFCKFHLCAV